MEDLIDLEGGEDMNKVSLKLKMVLNSKNITKN